MALLNEVFGRGGDDDVEILKKFAFHFFFVFCSLSVQKCLFSLLLLLLLPLLSFPL